MNFAELTALVDNGDVFFLGQELHKYLLNFSPVTKMDIPLTVEIVHAHQLHDQHCQLPDQMDKIRYPKKIPPVGAFETVTQL